VRQEGRGVEVDRVPARGLEHGHPERVELLHDVGDRADAVLEVVFVDHLLEPLREGLQVAPRQPP